MRPIMTRAELAAHEVDQHGRDYSKSDDGYSDMEVAASAGWAAIPGWGRDGYDLGDWPYVVISTRTVQLTPPGGSTTLPYYEMRQTVEGDTTVYRFTLEADRDAAIDYLFVWYGIGQEYDRWGVLGVTSREGLDAGALRVPEELRGPFSWARCDAETAPYGRCEECGRAIRADDDARLRADLDFVDHGGHLIRRVSVG